MDFGGVGSFVFESFARNGIENMILCDKDKFRAEIDKVKTRALTKFNFNIKSNDKIDEIQDLKGRQYNDKYQFGAIVDEKLENRNV